MSRGGNRRQGSSPLGQYRAIKALGFDVAAVPDALELAGAQGADVHLLFEDPSLRRHGTDGVPASLQQTANLLGVRAAARPALRALS